MFSPLYENTEIPAPISVDGINVMQGELKDISWIRPSGEYQRFDWNSEEILYKEREKKIFIAEPPKVPALQELTKWDDTEVTFLGTASAIPGKYRNGE